MDIIVSTPEVARFHPLRLVIARPTPWWQLAQADPWERDRWLMLQWRARALSAGAGD